MVSLLLLSALSSNCIIIPQRVGSSSSFLARPRLDVGKNMGSSAFPVRVNWAIGKPPPYHQPQLKYTPHTQKYLYYR